MRKTTVLLFICVMGLMVVAGCRHTDKPDVSKENDFSLKVMYWSERQFHDQFGRFYRSEFPNATFEIVEIPFLNRQHVSGSYLDTYLGIIEKEKPDIIFTFSDKLLEHVLNNNWIVPLDDYIAADGYSLETYHQAILDHIRKVGNGKIYGLSPTYDSMVLYYNKSLFDQYGIPYPEDFMTWQEILQVAERFSGDEPGFYWNENAAPYDLIRYFGAVEGLSMLSGHPGQERIVLNTESWKEILEFVVNGIRSGAIRYKNVYGGHMTSDDLLSGQNLYLDGAAAMTVDWYGLSYILSNNELLNHKFDWGMVAGPVSERNPSATQHLMINNLFSIYAKSQVKDQAWSFIKFINSDQFAQLQPYQPSMLMARNLERNTKVDPAVFTRLELMKNEALFETLRLPGGFMGHFEALLDEQIRMLVNGEQSIEEALSWIEQQGTAYLLTADDKIFEFEEIQN